MKNMVYRQQCCSNIDNPMHIYAIGIANTIGLPFGWALGA